MDQATVSRSTPHWLFGSRLGGQGQLIGFDDSAFTPVTLPHTVTLLSWQNWDCSAWEQVMGVPQALRRAARPTEGHAGVPRLSGNSP